MGFECAWGGVAAPLVGGERSDAGQCVRGWRVSRGVCQSIKKIKRSKKIKEVAGFKHHYRQVVAGGPLNEAPYLLIVRGFG